MTRKTETVEDTIRHLENINRSCRDECFDLGQELKYKNAEVEGYKQEVIYLLEKEKLLLARNEHLRKEVSIYQNLCMTKDIIKNSDFKIS